MNPLWKGIAAAALLQAAGLQAQETRPVRPPQVWLDPALAQQPIRLQELAIDIRVQGFVATTRLDFTFFNPNERVLEGELVFPLAEAQRVTGYALEVEGKLRQGVVVEKETARVAYESTVRGNIDPGLAELTQGNVFRTRLYPLPPRGSKRVQIAFDQPLIDTGSHYRYVLPLLFGEKIAQFKVHAEAVQAELAPTPRGSALTFERWRNGYSADLQRSDFQPERELAFDLPKPAQAVSVFSVADTLEPQWRHFAAQVQSAPVVRKPAAAPRRIAIFYDASGSAAQRDRTRELDLLAAWLGQIGQAEIDLVAFRNEADAPQHFRLRDGDASALRRAIEALPLDGASAYGALRLDGLAAPDVVLVIGDGLSNFGNGEPQLRGTGASPRLAFLHAAQTFDAARLARWASRDGGQVLNLLALDQATALRELQAPRWALQSVRVLRGRCEDLAPRAPQPAGATFLLYGRCSADAQLQLEFGDGAGNRLQRTLEPGSGEALDAERGEFVRRLWAGARIADLENTAPRPREEIVRLAKTHGVVTQDTSLLVLDRIEDYLRYQIEPREPELAAQYRTRLAALPKQAAPDLDRERHRAEVLAAWKAFRQWHETRHPWLETLLLPTARSEAQRWENAATPEDRRRLAQAREIVERAVALEQRWRSEGADPARRGDWEREAGTLMLQVDALRRLPAPPAEARKGQRIARDEASFAEAPMAMSVPAGAAPPSPAAPAVVAEAAPMRERAADGGGGADPKIARGDDAEAAETQRTVAIELGDWNPQTPYLATLRAAADPYAAYLVERRGQALTPAFFLDCATYFRNEAKNDKLALRVLSNLAEIDFESAPLLRVLAYRLQQWERFDLAVPLLQQALLLRGEEPQSRRDLALALSHRTDPDYLQAASLLWEIVDRRWDARFPEIEVIALHELNDLRARAPQSEQPALDALVQRLDIPLDLLEHQPADLRVVLSWDADNTDIDLWVVDPTGEVAIFRHARTRSGGHLSRDFTRGYGPEVFTIRRAIPGTYVVKTHYYASHVQKLTGAVTLQLEFLTGFDTGQSRREAVTRRLDDANGEIEIGRFTVQLQ